MKLEVGKSYRTRSGLRATCVADNLRGYQPFCVVVHDAKRDFPASYTADGFFTETRIENSWDLISEWSDKPEVNWSIIPPWFNWVAMDQSEAFYAYVKQPVAFVDEDYWRASDEDTVSRMHIHPDYSPKWSGNWRQSLVERPKV